MAGTNPYIRPPAEVRPTRKYTITYLPSGKQVEVDPAEIPYGRTGLPGSVLDVGLENGVDIDHACGGVVACSTCHVIVRAGIESCGEATEEELDQLDEAPGIEPNSRLACQCVANGSCDLVVEVPNWNRNLVSEAPH